MNKVGFRAVILAVYFLTRLSIQASDYLLRDFGEKKLEQTGENRIAENWDGLTDESFESSARNDTPQTHTSFSSGYNHRQNHDHTHKHKHGHKHGHDHSHKHSHTQSHTHVADHSHDHAHVHHHKHNHIHGHDEDHKHAHTEGHTHSHKYASGHRRSGYDDRRRDYERLAVDHTKDFLKTYMGSAYKKLTGY